MVVEERKVFIPRAELAAVTSMILRNTAFCLAWLARVCPRGTQQQGELITARLTSNERNSTELNCLC